MMHKVFQAALGGAAFALAALSGPAWAQQESRPEYYVPGIWIDPDGCAHWVMDDGAEGYMDNILRRDGSPVCYRDQICGLVPTDPLFATDSSHISAQGRASLVQFFQGADAFGYLIYGHTDSRGSDEYNIALSERRAQAVASVAASVGARVVDVKGFGERRPRADNGTAAGMRENRRVEIYCLR